MNVSSFLLNMCCSDHYILYKALYLCGKHVIVGIGEEYSSLSSCENNKKCSKTTLFDGI